MFWSADQEALFRQPMPKTYTEFLELIHPDNRGLFTQEVDIASDEPLEFVFRLNPEKYYSTIYIMNRFKVLKNDQGVSIGLEGVNTDLTSVLDQRDVFESFYNLDLVGNAVLDNDGRFISCNNKFAEITSYNRDEIVGELLGDVLQFILTQEDRKRLEDYFHSDESISIKTKICRGNESSEHISAIFNFTPIPEKGSHGVAVMDISELEKERALFKSFFYLPDRGKAIVRKGFKILKCNQQYEQILGYSEAELQLLKFEEYIVPDFQNTVSRNHYSRFSNNNQSERTSIVQVYHKKGHIITLKAHAERIEGTDLVFSSIEDITEEIAQKQELIDTIHERNSFRDALNESSLVSVTDLQGKIIFANEKFRIVSQYKMNELIGSDHNILNSGYHSKSFWVSMWKTITKGKAWRGEVKNKAKDGSYYWVDTTINPVRDAAGKIVQYLSVRNLITHKKELEENREALLKDFENFAFIASHKIRGPLARMMGLTHLINQGMISEDELEPVLQKLSIASNEMDAVIKEMVNLLSRNALSELIKKRE